MYSCMTVWIYTYIISYDQIFIIYLYIYIYYVFISYVHIRIYICYTYDMYIYTTHTYIYICYVVCVYTYLYIQYNCIHNHILHTSVFAILYSLLLSKETTIHETCYIEDLFEQCGTAHRNPLGVCQGIDAYGHLKSEL